MRTGISNGRSSRQTVGRREWASNRKSGARDLDAGAQVVSGQLGQDDPALRKAYNLSLSELAEQSGVAKSIISQIERNETNPTLATIWRLSQALDISIERVLSVGEDTPFLDKTSRTDTPILVSEDGKFRLAIIGWIKTSNGCNGTRSRPIRRRARFRRPSARLHRALSILSGEFRCRGRRRHPARQGRRHIALSLRPAPHRALRRPGAGFGHDGLHPQGRRDGVRPANYRIRPPSSVMVPKTMTAAATRLASARAPDLRRHRVGRHVDLIPRRLATRHPCR